MEGFRRLIKGWLGKVLLGAVVILFVISGAESLMSIATRPKPVAVVNGDEISRQELDHSVDIERRNIISRMGTQANLDLVKPEIIRPRVLDVLIDRSLLVQTGHKLGMYASDEAVKSWIMTMPQFQADGTFNEELFNRTVAQFGYSPMRFVSEVKSDYTINQLRSGLMDTAFLTNSELKRLVTLQNQTRDIRFVTLAYKNELPGIELTDEEITGYYQSHQEDFKTEEMVRVNYIEVSVDRFLEESQVSEADLRAAYEREAERIRNDEQRQAAHILISVDEDTTEEQAKTEIEALKKRIEAGEAFGALAKEFSDDPGSAEEDGDLGFAGKGAYVPEFEQALFSLQEGQVSDPVKTEFGYHLIKLHSIKKPEVPAFEVERDRLETQVKREKAIEVYFERLEELRTLAFESGDLQESAEHFKLTVQTSSWIKRTASNADIFDNKNLVQAAFSEEVLAGNNSDVIEVSDDKAVVLHLKEHQPERIKSKEEVLPQIEQLLKTEKAMKKAEKTGRDLIARVRAGESVDELVKNLDLTWTEKKAIQRTTAEAPREVLEKAFAISRPGESNISLDGVNSKDGFVVIQVLAVQEGIFDLDKKESENMSEFLADQLSRFDYQDFFIYYKNQADIKLNL